MNKNVTSDMFSTHCAIYQKHFQLVPLHKSKPQCIAVLGPQQTSELLKPLGLIFQKQFRPIKGQILIFFRCEEKPGKTWKNKQISECLKNNQLT